MKRPSQTDMITASGGFVDLRTPSPEDIHLEDIEASLAAQVRWTGHGERFSVLAHSVNVLSRVIQLGGNLQEQAQALMHDSAEAYTGDLSSPLKRAMAAVVSAPCAYRIIAARLNKAIGIRFGLELEDLPKIVKQADADVMAAEASYHWTKKQREGWSPEPDPEIALYRAGQSLIVFEHECERLGIR